MICKLNHLLLIFMLLHSVSKMNAQCTLSISAAVPPSTQVSYSLEVSGAINNDLSSVTQGVCAVLLEFDHPRISQTTVNLIAPSGDEIVLVGPLGAGGVTNNTTWNLTFLPCAIPPTPDPGFNANFNNLDAWGIFGNYNGSYHPNLGCLEDFNSGPVNGNWEIVVNNESPFDTFNLIGFSLLFCDDAGLDCFICSSNGGSITLPETIFCEQEEDLLLNIQRSFTGAFPDPDAYGYVYLILSNDEVIDTMVNPDLRPYTAGSYEVCGLSYLFEGDTVLPDVGDIIDIDDLRLQFDDPGENLCASLSDQCLNIEILESIDTTFIDTTLCAGDSIFFNSDYIFESGTFEQILPAQNGCDSVVILSVEILSLSANFDNLLELNCSTTEVSLNANIFQSDFDEEIFSWYNEEGNLISDELPTTVNTAGSYLLEITGSHSSNSCVFSFEYEVVQILEPYNPLFNPPDTVCISQIISIDLLNPIDNSVFNWSLNGSPQDIISVDDSSSISINLIQEGDTEICLNLSNPCFLDTILCDSIYVAGSPIIETSFESIVCGDDIIINVDGISDIEIIYKDGPQPPLSISEFNDNSFTVQVAQSGNYIFGFNTPLGVCEYLEEINVDVAITPDFNLDIPNDTLCIGEELSLITNNFSMDSLILFFNLNGEVDTIISPPGLSEHNIFSDHGNNNLLIILDSVSIVGLQSCTYLFEEEYSVYTFGEILVNSSIEICNSTETGQLTFIDLNEFISGNYSGLDIDAPSNIDISEFPIINFEDVTEGVYSLPISITYSDNCTEFIDTLDVLVTDCNCFNPELVQTDVSFCTSDVIDLSDFLEDSMDGIWTILEEPIGSQLEIVNNVFDASNGLQGQYSISFTPQQSNVDCPVDSVILNILLIDFFNAGNALVDSITLCPFRSDSIQLFDFIEDYDAGGSWQILSGNEEAFFLDINQGILVNVLPGNNYIELTYGLLGSSECSSEGPVVNISVLNLDYFPPVDTLFLTCKEPIVHFSLNELSNDSNTLTWSTRRNREIYDESTNTLSFNRDETLYLETAFFDTSCVYYDTIYIVNQSQPITNVDLEINHIPCPALGSTGSIEILNIEGGIPPYSLFIDDKIPPNNSLISNLRAGTYTLKLIDSEGCKWESTVELLDSDSFYVDIGPDLTVKPGESAEITFNTNLSEVDIGSWQWIVNGEILCPSCRILPLQPREKSGVILELFTDSGCRYTDKLNIFIDLRDLIFIPNAFTPNEDGINDVFLLLTNEESLEVMQLEIFDRWGSVVFEAEKYFPALTQISWDGYYKGNPLNPGIYICKVSIKLPNGVVQYIHQEFTLIR